MGFDSKGFWFGFTLYSPPSSRLRTNRNYLLVEELSQGRWLNQHDSWFKKWNTLCFQKYRITNITITTCTYLCCALVLAYHTVLAVRKESLKAGANHQIQNEAKWNETHNTHNSTFPMSFYGAQNYRDAAMQIKQKLAALAVADVGASCGLDHQTLQSMWQTDHSGRSHSSILMTESSLSSLVLGLWNLRNLVLAKEVQLPIHQWLIRKWASSPSISVVGIPQFGESNGHTWIHEPQDLQDEVWEKYMCHFIQHHTTRHIQIIQTCIYTQ